MTERPEYFDDYPDALKTSLLRSGQRCYRDKSYFALQGAPKAQIDVPVAWQSPGDEVAVYEGDPGRLGPGAEPRQLRPVYRAQPDGPPLVPTGMVFARFEEGIPVEGRRQQIADAGFDIDSVPSYAPHSAWLRPADGQVSSALAGLGVLAALADMVNVEPQLLGPRAWR